MLAIQEFLSEVIRKYKAGDATEHTYRPALAKLFESLDDKVSVTNEARRVTDAGSPDFTFRREDQTRGMLTIGHCECKDVGSDVRHPQGYSKEQKERYLEAFPNLLYTNGFEWVFYRDHDKKPIAEIRIADLHGPAPLPENFAELEARLREFVDQKPVSITTSRDLANRMAAKAKLISFVFRNALKEDKEYRTELGQQYQVFKDKLIHDITPDDFVGIYAETIAYGLFAARLQDIKTPRDFSREEAFQLLPKSIPFLKNLFQFIARQDLDVGLARAIDDLVEIFLVSEPWEIMKNYGSSNLRNDPFLHFYEDFLAAYDPQKRKARGVWYTPEPVVDFIVRAVDDVLKSEFGLPAGLADTSKTTIRVQQQAGQTTRGTMAKKPEFKDETVHRVQILDPAAGTGTFLAHTIKHIAETVKGSAGAGIWSKYVETDLIPRLHGFELLMASYAMCHLKLDMELKATGYTPSASPPRASVYLTNSLEEGEPPQPVLMLEKWLADEAREANRIKTEKPIMCIIGNPPYSGISQNNGRWIENLLARYKMEPGGLERLNERKHWLNDDYVKFIRMAESMIEKNGEGILGYITNHGYLDNPTFRGMRWHLLTTFDKIYILDLHGSQKKAQVKTDGLLDTNVFDIQQGVCIIVGVKTFSERSGAKPKAQQKSKLGMVFHADIRGSRQHKYDTLWESKIESIEFKTIEPEEPNFFFAPKDLSNNGAYQSGFNLSDFCPTNSTGVITARDSLAIDFEEPALRQKIFSFCDRSKSDEQVRQQYFGGRASGKYKAGDTRGWKLDAARAQLSARSGSIPILDYDYRPFDRRKIIFDAAVIDWPRHDVMKHLKRENLSLVFCRQSVADDWSNTFVASTIVDDSYVSNRSKERGYAAPLYLYPDEGEFEQTRRVNFDDKLYGKLRKLAKHPSRGEPDEVAVFDYIYGVLHCPAYRETYAEFLKIDFPRIPWPASPDVFWHVSDRGGQLRRLHLMEATAIGDTPFPFTGAGDGVVEKPELRGGAVWINPNQRFENIPSVSWDFYIGGYQPAQKWLKDRKGRALTFDDVKHYQRILKILAETDRIMTTIEMPLGAKLPGSE